MKQFFFFIFVLFLAACSSPAPTATPNTSAILTATAPQQPTSVAQKSSSPISSATVRPLVVAHRGGAALAPENTLGAFANAIQLGGVDMVECDVHLSQDGELIVMHDPNVATTTNGNGMIADLPLADLKKLNAAAKFPGGYAEQKIPTLGEVLDLVRGKVGIQIEIKNAPGNGRYAGIEQKVIDAVNARGMLNDVIIISFDFGILKDVKQIEPRVKTGALVRADWFQTRSPEKSVSDAIQQTGAEYFMPTASPVTQAIVDAAHARGIKMGVWTVDAPSDMKRYAGFGIDAITTNRPDELKKVLGK
jgi:glycerophosphoryl diester phosphodiesterase